MLEPHTTMLDLRTGALSPEKKLQERRLADLAGLFLEEIPEDRASELAYTVSEIPAPMDGANLPSSTTVIQPGRVGEEFFMTKGHFHANRDRAEIYLGLSGEGRLVMATEDGRSVVEPVRAGTVSYVPGYWAHRTVNVGDEPLVFYAVYPGDAGYDYATIADEGFPVVVLAGDGEPRVVPNPRYRAS